MPKTKHSKNKSTTRIRLSNELVGKINWIAEIYDISFHDALNLIADDTLNALGTALNLIPKFEPVTERECRKTARH